MVANFTYYIYVYIYMCVCVCVCVYLFEIKDKMQKAKCIFKMLEIYYIKIMYL